MKTRRNTPRLAAVALAATLSVTALGACGSSSSTAKKDTGKSSTATAKGSDNGPFCSAWVTADGAASKGPDSGESKPTAEQMTAFAKGLQGALGKVTSTAPSSLKNPVDKIVSIVDDAAAGKNPEALDPSSPALGVPLNKIEAWVHTSCGFTKLDVMGVDYAYKGVPSTIKAGVASIKFENMSDKEFHEMALIRIKDGSGVTSAELEAALKADANAAQQKYGDSVEFLSGAQAPPGATGYTTADLKAGDYLTVCFVPVGGKDGGVPHVQKGMVSTFKVA